MGFQRINTITGWAMFTIALVVYMITIEPTASFWDCGEFIASAFKLEVPHPPGAPFFLLIGRLFSFLALGDLTMVAYWINVVSALCGGFTVLFIFWSITLLARKLLGKSSPDSIDSNDTLLIIGAGVVGALACTFADSIWFSAVEAEVYSMSLFFTALVVWMMLKWESIDDEARANRWLLLLFFSMGLSIGVHLLNLVTIPALSLIYYFKKYKPGPWGITATLLISLLIIFFINSIIIPGLPDLAGRFEVFFVNTLGLPFGSGVIVFVIIILGALVFGIRRSHTRGKVLLNTSLLATAFILIGYSSYAIIVIRSNYNPPIDQNDPSDVMSFVRYLKREQYGSRPLLYGQYFDAERIGYKESSPVYEKGVEKYEIKEWSTDYEYDPARETILPRMWSSIPGHPDVYRELTGLGPNEVPDFGDNLYFMFKHQIGWMYIRYFMFNFAGRESDIQDANWIGPGDWFEDIPYELEINKGRNNLFMIPLILGIIGLLYQSKQNVKDFAAVGLLFILTGVALVVYLNSPPVEPRERDYIYAGSYYTFCIWIGLSVVAIARVAGSIIKNNKGAAIISLLIGLTAPVIMAAEGWDDHDRSGRFYSVDYAANYLNTCEPNGALFSGGDNDTFPLWYIQEVEGIRTDMRVIVLSYFNTDWYIGQSMRPAYESDAFPYTISLEQYKNGGPNDFLPYQKLLANDTVNLKEYIRALSNNMQTLRVNYSATSSANIVPARNFVLPVDVDRVRSMNIVPQDLDSLIVPRMHLRLKGAHLEKKDLALLDLLATTDWSRPLYVNNTSLMQFNVDLSPYVVLEGNAYRILPVRNPDYRRYGYLVDTEKTFTNLVEKFPYRNLDNPKVYYNQDYRSYIRNQRSNFNDLAQALIDKGETERARQALLFNLETIPDKAIPYDLATASSVGFLFEVGEREKAIEIARIMYPRADEMAAYLIARNQYGSRELSENFYSLQELYRALYTYGETELATEVEGALRKYMALFQR